MTNRVWRKLALEACDAALGVSRHTVYDLPHRHLLATYTALPEAQRRVKLSDHYDICLGHEGRRILPWATYYNAARPLSAVVTLATVMPVVETTHCGLLVIGTFGVGVAGIVAVTLRGWAYGRYLQDVLQMRADLEVALGVAARRMGGPPRV